MEGTPKGWLTKVGVARTPSTAEQHGVDDPWQGGDTGILDGDDKGRLGGGRSKVQRGVSRRNKQADEERGGDVDCQ